jgi:hypothetical protein
MELWRVCRPAVADSYHFEKQDPDPDSKNRIRIWNRIRITMKSWIRIRIKVFQIRNPSNSGPNNPIRSRILYTLKKDHVTRVHA